jgi:hypothetical protein
LKLPFLFKAFAKGFTENAKVVVFAAKLYEKNFRPILYLNRLR